MKKLRAISFGAFISLCFLQSSAQEPKVPINEPDYNKPKLFADLPQKMDLKITEMETLFKFSVGSVIAVQATDKLLVEGTVVSKSDAEDGSIKSVVIRCSNKQGSTFTFTKTTNADGTYNYIGRMMNRNNGDAFEIAKENGQYVLLKKNLYDLIAE